MRFSLDCDWKESIVGLVAGETVAIHSSGQTIFGFTHIECITLGAGEEIDEVIVIYTYMKMRDPL